MGPVLLALLALGAAAGATASLDDTLAEAGACPPSFPPLNATIPYEGGPIYSAVQLVPVMWTGSVSAPIQSWAQQYLSTLTGSAYFDLLAQYSTPPVASGGTGQTLGHGTATAPVVITPTVAIGSTVDDGNIGAELEAQITAGHLPAPTTDAQGYANTIYVLFFPAGTSITAFGGASCSTFCGYHSAYPASGKLAFGYVVVPSASPGSGCEVCGDPCTSGEVPIAASMSSFLVAEAVTNPVGSLGWIEPSQQETISRVCVGGGVGQVMNGTVPGTTIIAHAVWSQQDGQCLLAPGSGSGSGGSSGSGDPFGSSSGSPFGSSTGGVSTGSGSGGASSSGGGAPPAASGGCGCALAGGGAPATALVALAGLAALRIARGRRRP